MFTTFDVFDELLGSRNWLAGLWSGTPFSGVATDYPYVNLYEKDDQIEIAFLAPGENVEDINLQLVDNALIIEGEKKNDYEEKPYIRKERNFGVFKKTVKLPFVVDANNIEAGISNGILIVKLVKSEDVRPRKIEITH